MPSLETLLSLCSLLPSTTTDGDVDAIDRLRAAVVATARDPVLRSMLGDTVWPALTAALESIRDSLRRRLFPLPSSPFDADEDHDPFTDVKEVVDKDNALTIATLLLQLARNLCAIVPENQSRLLNHGVHVLAEDMAQHLATWTLTIGRVSSATQNESPERAKNITAAINMATQMLANASTANERIQDLLWPRYFEPGNTLLSRMLMASDDDSCRFVLTLIHNSTYASRTRASLLVSTDVGRNLLLLLMNRAITLFDSDHRNGELIFVLVNNLTQLDLLIDAMSALADHSSRRSSSSTITASTAATGVTCPEELMLLKILDGAIEARLARSSDTDSSSSSDVAHHFSDHVIDFYVTRLGTIVAKLDAIVGPDAHPARDPTAAAAAGATTTTTSATETGPSLHHDDVSAVVLLLHYLAHAASGDDDASTHHMSHPPRSGPPSSLSAAASQASPAIRDRRLRMSNLGLSRSLVTLISLLTRLSPPRTRPPPTQSTPTTTPPSVTANGDGDENKGPLFMVKVDAIKVVVNLCHGVKHIQDEFREIGGLVAVLNCCHLDDENPYIKEWAVFAIRNLCEDNDRNQELVRGLEARQVVDDSQGLLSEAGMRARIDETGRVKIGPNS